MLVSLRNGSVVPKDFAESTMVRLRNLAHKDLVAFFHFIMFCRDRGHVFPPDDGTPEVLVRWGLLEKNDDGYAVDAKLCNVALSCAIGDKLIMRIVDPWKAETT